MNFPLPRNADDLAILALVTGMALVFVGVLIVWMKMRPWR